MRTNPLWIVVIFSAGVGVVAVAYHPAPRVASFPAASESLLDSFQNGLPPGVKAYDNLFLYFLEGFETYRTPGGSGAIYPGLPSRNGASADRLEGFSRIVPLMGAWVRSGRPDIVKLDDGRTLDLCATFRRGLISGTDPRSPEYWGEIRDGNQRIVEASDVALALWLFGDRVWGRLTPTEQGNVAAWLREVERKRVPDNNWHLFPVFISSVLKNVGVGTDSTDALRHYTRFKEFYRGHGWFSDGPNDIFDYYNAWSIHYQLYWLHQVDPSWDPDFISRSLRQFLASYRYLFGPEGFPIIGRSVCYRMAAPVALVFGQEADPDVVTPAEARRALDVTWAHFIQKHGVRFGTVTQGFCGPDPRILDNYSGPASCLWALRSLIAAFALPQGSQFWAGAPGSLPVESGSYNVTIPELRWTITGDQKTRTILIRKPGEPTASAIALADYGLARRIASAVLWRPFRPNNQKAKYQSDTYDSAKPFCGCEP